MSEPLTNSDLDAMQARCDAATPGPWYANENEYASGMTGPTTPTVGGATCGEQMDYSGLVSSECVVVPDILQVYNCELGCYNSCIAIIPHRERQSANTAFIANSRTDLPRLVAEVRRLRALVGHTTEPKEGA